MKLLHLSFHRDCQLEIEYVFKKIGHEITTMKFDTGYNEINEFTQLRAQNFWEKNKDYFNTFDGIITSYPTSLSRIFLQNDWPKLLIIWVCNRFDCGIQEEYMDPGFYNLLRSIKNRKNVYIFGNSFIENIYSTYAKNVDIGNFIIKLLGKTVKTDFMYKTYSDEESNVFYIPPGKNETQLLNVSKKLDTLDIQTICERFNENMIELLGYKGVICIPYSWSSIAFFERLQLGIVTFLPTERFLIELFSEGEYWFEPPFNVQQTELLKITEWYAQEHRDFMVYFDSWNDLKMKIQNTNYKDKTTLMLNYAKMHEKETLERWNHVINDYLQFTFVQPDVSNIPVNIEYSENKSIDSNTSCDNKVSIILTCSVHCHSKIKERNNIVEDDSLERADIYVKSVKKWLYETSLPIILVENSGYEFPELEFEKDMFKERFEIVLFDENEVREAAYLKDNHSKGTHEVFSIYYAKRQSKLISQSACNFIIKVTGRFFIPEFESYLKKQDLSNIKALRQNNVLNCQIVGTHIDQFSFIFNKRCFYRDEYAKYENDFIEILYKDKIDSLPKENVLNCPVFEIEPTIDGKNETITSL
jgi:hypothetical protein